MNTKVLNYSVTIADVAAEAKVSVPTVSRILNNKAYVSDETRNRVNQAIIKLGYVQTILATKC